MLQLSRSSTTRSPKPSWTSPTTTAGHLKAGVRNSSFSIKISTSSTRLLQHFTTATASISSNNSSSNNSNNNSCISTASGTRRTTFSKGCTRGTGQAVRPTLRTWWRTSQTCCTRPTTGPIRPRWPLLDPSWKVPRSTPCATAGTQQRQDPSTRPQWRHHLQVFILLLQLALRFQQHS